MSVAPPTEAEVKELQQYATSLENGCYLDTPRDNLGREVASRCVALCDAYLTQREALAFYARQRGLGAVLASDGGKIARAALSAAPLEDKP